MKISLFHKNKTTTVAAGAARWQAGPAYVRGTKYDVRFGEFGGYAASLAKPVGRRDFCATGGRWRLEAPICTIEISSDASSGKW